MLGIKIRTLLPNSIQHNPPPLLSMKTHSYAPGMHIYTLFCIYLGINLGKGSPVGDICSMNQLPRGEYPMTNIIKLQTYSKLCYIQSFVHAPNNPFGQHLSKDTIHAPTDGRKSGHFQGRLGINQVQNLELFHLTAHAIGYTAHAHS